VNDSGINDSLKETNIMKTKVALFQVLKGTVHMGLLRPVNFEQACARARGRYGICDVELAYERKPLAKERRQANALQQGKQSRRYPTPGFEARRAALIAELLD
jgi:hypothetical protein